MNPIAVGLGVLGGVALCATDTSGSALAIARLAIVGVTLGAASAIDVAEHRIPNRLVYPAAGACAGLTIAGGFNAAADGLVAIAFLLVASLLAPSALGIGDIKLMLVVVLGLQQDAVRALLVAVLIGIVVVIARGRQARRRPVPLAPFIALGTLLAVL